MQQEGYIFKDSTTGNWTWDETNLGQTSSARDGNVITLLANKIQQLPMEIQHVLQVAASLGGEFDIDIS